MRRVKDVHFFSDMLKFLFSDDDIRNNLNNDVAILGVKKKFNIQKISFNFVNLKKYGGIKFADFIAGILRKRYIGEEKYLEQEFKECFVGRGIYLVKMK